MGLMVGASRNLFRMAVLESGVLPLRCASQLSWVWAPSQGTATKQSTPIARSIDYLYPISVLCILCPLPLILREAPPTLLLPCHQAGPPHPAQAFPKDWKKKLPRAAQFGPLRAPEARNYTGLAGPAQGGKH